MSQTTYNVPDSDGATFLANLNAVLDAVGTSNKGSSRPATIGAGMTWLDDNTPSSTTWTLNLYDGSEDIVIGTFDTVSNKFLPANAGATVATVKRQVFATPGVATYNPSAGMLFCLAEAVGGGGGGGGTTSGGTSGSAAAACGGGGGGYARKLLAAAQVTGPVSCVIGSGGTGASGTGATTGAAGGNTTFGGFLTAGGGAGGGGDSPKNVVDRSSENAGPGGSATGGDVNVPGGGGSWGIAFGGRGTAVSGRGGDSFYGSGGESVHEVVVGVPGKGYGGGGSGGASVNNAARGGDGAPGLILVTEWCSQ